MKQGLNKVNIYGMIDARFDAIFELKQDNDVRQGWIQFGFVDAMLTANYLRPSLA